ncbi:MAG TPA: AMP-binding protein, partial [Bacteroidia bacterium]|nr:AMP-binding protein [Bacteroidia bacterium]
MNIPPSNIFALFQQTATRIPQQAALINGQSTISFTELGARAGRLAAILQKTGAERGATVALCLDRSPELIIAVLGIVQ